MSTPTDPPVSLDEQHPSAHQGGEKAPTEMNLRELARWFWRQITSMRTALILLLILAVAAIPGSLIPQSGVDALKTSQWQDAHPKLTPIYEKLGLFSVYNSFWFSAIYVLLMISLVGCILPRLVVYAKALRARPPKAPRNLGRLPHSRSFHTDASPEEVLAAARGTLKKRRFRTDVHPESGSVSAERGYAREAGNLLFHLAILVVLCGFALGNLFGYKGGVILLVGNGFTNNLTQYDDFNPGRMFTTDQLDDFTFDIESFDLDWLTEGAGAGQARKFVSHLKYSDGDTQGEYDLKVNHPLTLGSTGIFLIGHGYAPVLTIRDGEGNITSTGPSIFLPQDNSFRSFGVVKAADAKPDQIGLEGEFYPTMEQTEDGMPYSIFGDDLNPYLSMTVWSGDLGMDEGNSQSVYLIDTDKATPVKGKNGAQARVDLRLGETKDLPNGMGTVTFESVATWNKLQISQTPGMKLTLGGVVAALIGLLGSLFIKPRRVWVRSRRENGVTIVEVAALDRSSGGDVTGELDAVTAQLTTTLGEASPDAEATNGPATSGEKDLEDKS